MRAAGAWDARPVADSCQFASRVQSAVRFQVASELQLVLDRALPGLQVPAALLACLGLECAVRAGASFFDLLRDIAFIQLGQCIMTASKYLEHHAAPAQLTRSEIALFLLRTLLLCLPPLVLGIGAGLGIRATMTQYVQAAITAYQYRYAADAGAVLRKLDFGASLALLGTAALRVSSGVQNLRAPAAPAGILSLSHVVMHIILVDCMLFELTNMHYPPHVRLGLTLLALVALDAVVLILDHEPHDVLETLQQVRGYALWRAATQLRGQFEQIDFLTVSCVALLLAVCRTTLAFARPSVAHGVADSHPSLTKTLSELGLFISIQMLLVPTTQDSSQSIPQHLLRILCIATAANWVEKALSAQIK
jgi:hypothetical protein